MDVKNFDAVSRIMMERARLLEHLDVIQGKDANAVLSRVASRAGSSMVDNGVSWDENMAKAITKAVTDELLRRVDKAQADLAEYGVTGVN